LPQGCAERASGDAAALSMAKTTRRPVMREHGSLGVRWRECAERVAPEAFENVVHDHLVWSNDLARQMLYCNLTRMQPHGVLIALSA
jgi:hypothetical protein